MENYLKVLEDSLRQKSEILDKIAEYSDRQGTLLKQDKLDLEEFDAYVDRKDELIQKLAKLDEGFEVLYDRIKEQLQGNKEKHANQIAVLQKLISQVTEKSVSIQTQENRNKAMLETHFKNMRQGMRQGVRNSKAAYDYYKSMSSAGSVLPQYMDQKQ